MGLRIKVAEFLKVIVQYIKYTIDLFNGNGPFSSHYRFENRKQDKSFLLYILAGYKPFLWEDVFERVNLFMKDDMEVCVLSSGRYEPRLSEICEKYGYSYLSTSRNNICVISNIVLKLYDKAEYVYKMDEDIYVTEGVFQELQRIYHLVEKEEHCHVGFVGPFIPINSFCLDRFIHENGVGNVIHEMFGEMIRGDCIRDPVRFRSGSSLDCQIWSWTGNIDDYARSRREVKNSDYEFCTFRYMIGLILFKRSLWESMRYFKVRAGRGSGTEGDEGQILTYCCLNSYATICALHTSAGHFSFGGCEQDVLKLRKEHPEYFFIKY